MCKLTDITTGINWQNFSLLPNEVHPIMDLRLVKALLTSNKLPIFLYGSDCWVISKMDARK